jgi:thymidylate synthase ThyX
MTADEFYKYLDTAEAHYGEYQKMLDKGVAWELARIGLPFNVYTEWYWKIDLHNLLHFLSLRMDAGRVPGDGVPRLGVRPVLPHRRAIPG